MQQTPKKSRDWCFTINNYDTIDILNLDQLRHNVKYIIYGKELGELRTPHLQGFIQYAHPVSFTKVKGDLRSNAHIESRLGTVKEAIEYCKKDGEITEYGEPQRLATPKETQKEVWRELIELSENAEFKTIKEKYPGYYFRYYEKIKSLAKGTNLILSELQHEWCGDLLVQEKAIPYGKNTQITTKKSSTNGGVVMKTKK